MALLRYETLDDFFNDYDFVDVHIIARKWVGRTQVVLCSMGYDGFYLCYGTPSENGRYIGKAFVSNDIERLWPLYNNFQ